MRPPGPHPAPRPSPRPSAHLEEADDHHILGVHECASVLLVLQPPGRAPPAPQPLAMPLASRGSEALS